MARMQFNSLMPELYVTDFDVSLRFYMAVLGFRLEYQRDHPRFAFLSRAGSQLMIQELLLGEREKLGLEYPLGRGMNLEIATPDLDVLITSLEAHAYPIVRGAREIWRYVGEKNSESGSREIAVHDPDGYLLRFSQDLGERSVG